MKFTEEKAQKLQKQYNLSKTVINKWRFRNSIPKKYEQSNVEFNQFDVDKILKILSDERLCRATIERITKIPHSHLSAYITGQRKLNFEKHITLKKCIENIKIEITRLISIFEKNKIGDSDIRTIMNILDKKYFYLNRTISEDISQKISSFKGKSQTFFPIEDKDLILQGLIELKLKLHT